MDCSTISEYENVSINPECSESVLYQAVNNILSSTTTIGNKIFCPLCVNAYEFRFALLDHVKNSHTNFLFRTAGKSYIFDQCPFCYANFFGRNTVIKHVLQTHAKVVTELYLQVGDDTGFSKCFFCSELHRKNNISGFISHIEQIHFLQFTELFEEQFMTIDDSFLSPKAGSPARSTALNLSGVKSLGKSNCFDLACLKEQLYNVEDSQVGLKSILKSSRSKLNQPSPVKKAKVCRNLKFDIPDDENKENSMSTENVHVPKQTTVDEHSLSGNVIFKQNEFKNMIEWSPMYSIKPIHCSTPKVTLNRNKDLSYKSVKNKKLKSTPKKTKLKVKQKKPTFKSYCVSRGDYYQCGKCEKLFQENVDLNYHIKKNHKLFIVNLLHPCYQCAICKAKFFKNYYLKKHIMLHSSTRKKSSKPVF